MKNFKFRAFAALSLLPAAAFASNSTPIDECGFVINQPGKYKLVQNLDCSATPYTPAIRILNTQMVKLDLNGYRIRGKYNAAYFGQGTGVFVYGSRLVEIEGAHHSHINYMTHALKIQNSERIKVDGDGLTLARNNQGVLVLESDRVKIQEVNFRTNKQRDLQVVNSERFKGERLTHFGGTSQGILLSQTRKAELERVRLGQQQGHFRAILLFNADDTEIKRARIARSQQGVWLSGAGTQDTEIKHSEFQGNTCDIRVEAGADAPDVDSSQSPSVCP